MSQAWEEQEKIGWINMLKGRISRTWATAQSKFYREFPDTSEKKTCTGLGWSIQVIKELTTMSLAMWKNRCGCMHGNNVVEVKRIMKERLRDTIKECYLGRDKVPQDCQNMFSQPLNDLIKKHSMTYLQAWIDKYEAHKLQENRSEEERESNLHAVGEGSSDDSVSTMDMDEYLVTSQDTYETMATNGHSECVQSDAQEVGESGPFSSSEEKRQMWENWGAEYRKTRRLDDKDMGYRWKRRSIGKVPGNVELNKRRPPDRR